MHHLWLRCTKLPKTGRAVHECRALVIGCGVDCTGFANFLVESPCYVRQGASGAIAPFAFERNVVTIGRSDSFI